MSSYKGQRGPNVSLYIATLNQPSPQQDLLVDPAPGDDFSDFLNAEFFDVSNSHTAGVDFSSPGEFNIDFDSNPSPPLKTGEGFQTSPTSAGATMDFNLNGKRSVILPTVISLAMDCYCRVLPGATAV